MRALVLYVAFGLVSAAMLHGGAFRFAEAAFWIEVAAWPVVALDRVVDLRSLMTPAAQDYVMLGFAAALVVYGVSKFEPPFARATRAQRARPRRPGR